MLRVAMTIRFHRRALQLLLVVTVFFVCGIVTTPDAVAQKLPKATGKEPENKSGSSRSGRGKRKQPIVPVSRTPASVESNSFLELGNRLNDQKRLNAAEAAYKEAIKAWPGNAVAMLELGFLYIDRNKIDDAQETYTKLRPLNASYASELLAEINRLKTSLAH